MKRSQCLLSIVLPAHNEAAGIQHTIEAIAKVVEQCNIRYEFIVVDDGSKDWTFLTVSKLIERGNDSIKAIKFSRNFGKEAAILAGLKHANGDVIITMDADLQHPPEIIPQMLDAWDEGAQIVSAVKQNRSQDNFITRFRAKIFNGILTRLGGINVRNSSDFKLLDREIVDIIINQIPEKIRFYRGLADWIGFRQMSIPFTVASRNAGEGKWSLWGLIELATTAVISFTSAPLRIVTFLGIISLIFAFVVASDALWSWANGSAVSGFATIIITLLLLGSFIMISLGIMGEYIAKIYDEIKARPPYLIQVKKGFNEKEL